MSGRGTFIVIIALIQLLFVRLSPNAISADSIHLIGCGLDAVSADSIHLIGCGLDAVSADSIHLIGCCLNAVSADSIHFTFNAIPFSFMLCCEKEVMGNCHKKLFDLILLATSRFVKDCHKNK